MNNNKLDFLLKKIETKDTLLSFLKVFETCLKTLETMKVENQQAAQDLKAMVYNAVEEFKKIRDETLVNDFKELKKETESILNKALDEQSNSLNFIRDKVRNLKNGEDGEKGERGEKGEDADEEKIKEELLDFIKKELEKIPRPRQVVGGGFSVMAMEQHFIDSETPTGTVNGVNTDFVIKYTPSPATSLKVYLDGQRMKLTTDYTFSVRTISFLTAPLTGGLITCDYRI